MQRVLQVDLAFDGSFVVLASSWRGEAIMHYTNKNQLLSCYNYPLGQVNMFSMLNSAEVWVPLPRSSELTTIDLRSKVISGMKYDFMRKDFNDL